jgi:hypothetical protein
MSEGHSYTVLSLLTTFRHYLYFHPFSVIAGVILFSVHCLSMIRSVIIIGGIKAWFSLQQMFEFGFHLHPPGINGSPAFENQIE